MAVHVRVRLRVATRWWWGAIALVGIASARWRWVVVHRWSATWWAETIFAWVVVVSARWWCAAAVVVATWAVATRRTTAVVEVVAWWWAVTATTVAWRTRSVALTWARDFGLRLIRVSHAPILGSQGHPYIGDAANRGVLEAVVIQLLNRSSEIRTCLVLDKTVLVSNPSSEVLLVAYPLPVPLASRSRATSL